MKSEQTAQTNHKLAVVASNELLDCPFCGPVEIVHKWAGNIEIKHADSCFLHAITTLHGAAHIAAWNRRKSNPGLQGTGHLVDRTLQGVVGSQNQEG
jgi:hypothetical protein